MAQMIKLENCFVGFLSGSFHHPASLPQLFCINLGKATRTAGVSFVGSGYKLGKRLHCKLYSKHKGMTTAVNDLLLDIAL